MSPEPISGTTMLIAAAVLAAAAAGTAGVASYQAGKAQEEAMRNQAQLARQTAALEAFRKRREGEAIIAKQRAMYAAGGIISDVGTPLLVQETTARNVEFDAQVIKWGGAARAGSALFSGAQAAAQGENALIGGGLKAGSSLLSGASGIGAAGKVPEYSSYNMPTAHPNFYRD